jgi:hypothetical protein
LVRRAAHRAAAGHATAENVSDETIAGSFTFFALA